MSGYIVETSAVPSSRDETASPGVCETPAGCVAESVSGESAETAFEEVEAEEAAAEEEAEDVAPCSEECILPSWSVV